MACSSCAKRKAKLQQQRAKAVPVRQTTATNVLSRKSTVFSRPKR